MKFENKDKLACRRLCIYIYITQEIGHVEDNVILKNFLRTHSINVQSDIQIIKCLIILGIFKHFFEDKHIDFP